MELTLRQLKPGDRFRKWDGRIGTLLLINDCRARIKLDGVGSKVVAFEDPKNPGREISFEAEVGGGIVNISPASPVIEILGHVDIDEESGRPRERREEAERKFQDEFVILHTDSGKHKAYIVMEFTGMCYRATTVDGQPRTGFDSRAEAQAFIDSLDENAREKERIRSSRLNGTRYNEDQFCGCKK